MTRFLLFLLLFTPSLGWSSDSISVSKKLSFFAAKQNDKAYEYANVIWDLTSKKQINTNINLAIDHLNVSIYSLDSAIKMADSSEVLGIKYASVSINYAKKALKGLKGAKKVPDYLQKKDLAQKSLMNIGHAITDAYTASFYFNKLSAQEVKEDNKMSSVNKLEIDLASYTKRLNDLYKKSAANAERIKQLRAKKKRTPQEQKELDDLIAENALIDKETAEIAAKIADIEAQLKLAKEGKSPSGGQNGSENPSANGKNNIVYEATSANPSDPRLSKVMKDEWGKPLLDDASLPDGLVYRVQIGVYQNEIPIETFLGLSPIVASVVEQGVSYSTGLFEKYDDAAEAKKFIISLGLKDAFIKAFSNKKKVDIKTARALEAKRGR